MSKKTGVFDVRIKANKERAKKLFEIVEAKKEVGKYNTMTATIQAIILEYGDFKKAQKV